MNGFTKKGLKYTLVFAILLALSVGGYYLYSYFKTQYLDDYVMLVIFKVGVTEDQAIATVSKYESSVASRSTRDYDVPFFAYLSGFKNSTIEFKVKGYQNWISVRDALSVEPDVQGTGLIAYRPDFFQNLKPPKSH